MSELLRLAELCEKASGPDRELDCLIFESRHRLLTPERRGTIDGEPTGQYFDLDGNQLPEHAPFYTASIDAAMTLMPSDVWLTLDRYSISDNPDHQHMKWRVWVKKLVGDIEGDGPAGLVTHFATGATPALALCAASLRVADTAGVRG